MHTPEIAGMPDWLHWLLHMSDSVEGPWTPCPGAVMSERAGLGLSGTHVDGDGLRPGRYYRFFGPEGSPLRPRATRILSVQEGGVSVICEP